MADSKKTLAQQAKQFSQLLKDYGMSSRLDNDQSKKNTQ